MAADDRSELLDEDVDWMFWSNRRPRLDSAWNGHVPFAHWIFAATKPAVLVELGTHSGASYSAFCEAALHTGTPTRCFAVDTWKGDEHAGSYSEAIYLDLAAFNSARYGTFSKLLRKTFDEALAQFPNSRAVVLFHDTNERGGTFGVWRLWEELRRRYPGFEFLHSHGLGVLQVGAAAPQSLAALCAIAEPKLVDKVRFRFQFLGEHVEMQADLLKLSRQLQRVRTPDRSLDDVTIKQAPAPEQ